MLTPEQESALTSSGDCFDHYHSSDRVATHDTLGQLQQLETIQTKTAPYTLTKRDDIVLVPGGGTIILPPARNGGEFQVIMSGATPVVISFSGTDTAYGVASFTLTTKGSTLRFKAIPGGWIILSGYRP